MGEIFGYNIPDDPQYIYLGLTPDDVLDKDDLGGIPESGLCENSE